MSVSKHAWKFIVLAIAVVGLLLFLVVPNYVKAINIQRYSDLISDSGPGQSANHTLRFTLDTNVSPGGIIEVTPPEGFEVPNVPEFGTRNVEVAIDGITRSAAAAVAPGIDRVEIIPGSPGQIRYTLAPDSGITSGAEVEIKIGNHTSNSVGPTFEFSSTTGTTTIPGDIEPIINSLDTGTHTVKVEVYDGGLIANAGFLIALVDKVEIAGVDTTEDIPPFRFNGAPTSTVGGTTLSVEISFETDEFAICRFSRSPGVSYFAMPNNSITNTGIIFHSSVVAVVPGSFNTFYIRCIDDEGNFNIDDFEIAFSVNEVPTGESNEDGNVDGDGTGTGNSGSGSGSGGGGTSGSSDGVAPTTGGTSGGGGSGGGGGGGSGGRTGNSGGGGFESTDAPFQSGDGRVVITGLAFPNSNVTFLVDGKIAQTVRAGGSGAYSVTLDQIARGAYTFGVYAAGGDNVKSSTFSTSFTVTGARTSALSNINISPSIKASPDPVDPGQTLTLSGYAIANSTLTIQNSRIRTSTSASITASADGSGRWTTTLPTSNFTIGTYQVRARSAQEGGATTNFSEYTFYGVGEAADVPLNADLNTDGRINLTDFSILLFWWNSTGGDSNPPADINRDGRVTLTDFSILLFNWTG
jgi:hypothetical protein